MSNFENPELFRYKGSCCIFAGIEKQTTYNYWYCPSKNCEYLDTKILCNQCDLVPHEYWEFEVEEVTKKKLTDGLLKVGIICEDIKFIKFYENEGKIKCEVTCVYPEDIDLDDSILDFIIDDLVDWDYHKKMWTPSIRFSFIQSLGKA